MADAHEQPFRRRPNLGNRMFLPIIQSLGPDPFRRLSQRKFAERDQIALRLKRGTPHALQCNEGGDYLWKPDPIYTSVVPLVPIVWCGRPHGVTEKWRNVIYSDLSIRRVSDEVVLTWKHE